MENVYIKIKDLCGNCVENYIANETNKDIISIYELIGIVEDLVDEKEHLEDELNVLKNDLESNYKPLTRSEYTGNMDDDRY